MVKYLIGMQNAKRMILVDENFFQRHWKKPLDEKVKSQLNRELKSHPDDDDKPDDLKAKEHRQLFHKFLNTRNNIPEQVPASITLNFDEPKTTPRRKSKRKPKKIRWEGFDA